MTNVKVEFPGLPETLQHLRRYEPDLYKQIAEDLKTAAEPLARVVGSKFPQQPLERWHKSGDRRGKSRMPPYKASAARAGVKPIINTNPRPRGIGNEVGILRLEQRNAGGQVFDSAGSANPSARFVMNLDKHRAIKSAGNGFRSRILFPAAKAQMSMIEVAVRRAIEKYDSIVQAKIVEGF